MDPKLSRRSLLGAAGTAGLFTGFGEMAMAFQPNGPMVYEEAQSAPQDETSKHKIRFGVIGLDHDHINGITSALKRGGGELVSVYSNLPPAIADYKRRNPEVKVAAGEDEILNDPSIQLIASAGIPNLRTPVGLRAMKHGKDYLSDKPAITTMEQLAEVRKTIKETGRIFGIMYSERLGVRSAVKAGELVKAGAIGKVVQVLIIAPHQVNEPVRPAWFWDPEKYGGILVDIGSHQIDQFTYYTGSMKAEVVAAQIANIRYQHHPQFQDFGDVMLHSENGFGYVRVDWFTPNGLGTWGDGRLFLLGTDGYIEVRKYADIAGRPGGDHLIVVDHKQARYIDCSKGPLPFGSEFVSDIVNRTHVAQDQEQALLVAELSIHAQKTARRYGVA